MAMIPKFSQTSFYPLSAMDLAVQRFANHAFALSKCTDQEKVDFINYFINNDFYFENKLRVVHNDANVHYLKLLINQFLNKIRECKYI